MNIQNFWKAVLNRDAGKIKEYFHEDAYVNWHCTNEHFSVEEYIRANCEYPGEWDGTVERVESAGGLTITVVNVYTRDKSLSFHVVSFMKIRDGRISALDEYWGDDGDAPQWRLEKKLGTRINRQL